MSRHQVDEPSDNIDVRNFPKGKFSKLNSIQAYTLIKMKYEDLNERGELRPWEENHIKSDIHLVKGQRWSPIHRTRKRQEKYSSFLGRCQRIGDHMFLLASLALGFRNYDKVNATDRDLLDQALRQCSFRSSKIEKVADGVNFRNLCMSTFVSYVQSVPSLRRVSGTTHSIFQCKDRQD